MIYCKAAFLLLFVGVCVCGRAQLLPVYKFAFSKGHPKGGFTNVLPGDTFSVERGYGYDLHTRPEGTRSFYFSVRLPEGNYDVTVKAGDADRAVDLTIRAEGRRLLLEPTHIAKGGLFSRSWSVYVKGAVIEGVQRVTLKPREVGRLDWDDKLTLEFNGAAPDVTSVEIVPNVHATTVYLAGNSTVVDQEEEPWASWGQMLPRFFKPGVAIANHAESGLSLGSFQSSHRLEKVLSRMRAGDYLFVEFGHNDQKEKGPDDGAWKSYSQRLTFFVEEARKRGGIPVIVTSTSRRSFDSTGQVVNTLGDYPAAAREVAKRLHVPLIELNGYSKTLYEALGVEGSKKAFVHYPAHTFAGQDKPLADNTHFNTYGAYELAKCVVEGLKANGLGLTKFLRNDTPVFDAMHPDDVAGWNWPLSVQASNVRPDGN